MSSTALAGTVEALVRSRAHPGCYGCLGTGTLRWAGQAPNVPCSCVMHSWNYEPDLHGPDCPSRQWDENADERTLRGWDDERTLAHLHDGRLAALARGEAP